MKSVYEQVWNKPDVRVWTQLRHQVERDEVWDQPWDQVSDQVWIQVRNQLWDHIYVQVSHEISL